MLKTVDFNLLRISPEFLTDQNRFIPFLSKTASQYFITWLLIAVKIVSEYDQEIPQSQTADNPIKQKVKIIDNSVVHELELAIKRDL